MGQAKQVQQWLADGLHWHRRHVLGKASQCYQKILAHCPQHADALHLMGVIANQTQAYPQAIQLIQQALNIAPKEGLYYSNLGLAFEGLLEFDEAETCYRRALHYQPTLLDAENNLASLLSKKGDLSAAIDVLEHILTKNPNHLAALCNLGKAYERTQQHEKAYTLFQRAYTIAPEAPEVLCRYTPMLLDTFDWQQLADCRGRLLTACQQAIAEHRPLDLDHYHALHLITDNATLFAVTRHVAQHQGHHAPPRFTHAVTTTSCLRIGYLSPDFNDHVVGYLLADLFSYHRRPDFHITAFDLGYIDDATRACIAQSCDQMIRCDNLTPHQVSTCIHEQSIDILVDLTGLTAQAQPNILVHKPAPIQCYFLGDCGTLGLPCIDYYFTTVMECPPDQQRYFTETFAYLPCPFARTPFKLPESLPRAEDYGLDPSAFIFCCFKHHRRIDHAVFAAWMQILMQTEQSQLWLQVSTTQQAERLRAHAASYGLADRLVFSEKLRLSEHWPQRLAHCSLDTFILSGGTSNFMTNCLDLPIVSLLGEAAHNRAGAALLHARGLDELIATSTSAYIALATRLANDREFYHRICRTINHLRTNDPTQQPEPFVRHLEHLYRQFWQNALDAQANLQMDAE